MITNQPYIPLSCRTSSPYLFVLRVHHKRPGGSQEFDKTQQQRCRMEAAGYHQPAKGGNKRDERANLSGLKYIRAFLLEASEGNDSAYGSCMRGVAVIQCLLCMLISYLMALGESEGEKSRLI